MNKTNCFSTTRNYFDKIENLIKENQSHKSIVYILCKGKMWVPQLYCSFKFPQTF